MERYVKLKNKLIRALLDSTSTIDVYFECPTQVKDAEALVLYHNGKKQTFVVKYITATRVGLKIDSFNIKEHYIVEYENQTTSVIPHGILDSRRYQYNGSDLGVTYTSKETTFKVFAPTATAIFVKLYDNLDGKVTSKVELAEGEYGVWSVAIKGNLVGKFYAYNVYGALEEFQKEKDVLDPYAKCVIGNTGKAMVIDESKYGKVSKIGSIFSKDEMFRNSKSIVYEISIRDISSDENSGSKYRGKFKALTEHSDDGIFKTSKGINVKIKRLMSHIKELGVNTVQIMPLQDFENDESDPNFYAWGYMPRFFNSPDGIFASNWKDDSKIRELRELVSAFHKQGLRVTLDVVYNHTAEGFCGNGIYSFNAFVPYFYYRFGNGYISNGSGCGNEMRTEAPMVRKFIIDTLIFWTNFYGFDGYRFDLMGLIDQDTMVQIVKELRHEKSDIFIYGEPWTGGLTPIAPTYKGSQRHLGFSAFNDDFRDAIKGAVFDSKECGYVQSEGSIGRAKVIDGILGSINTFAANPYETLNYAEVHDNNTLFDKLYFTLQNTDEFRKLDYKNSDDVCIIEQIKEYHKLVAFILLTSQGIPVLHLGQDFMRTKQGVENSYNSGDIINGVDWSRKAQFHNIFEYYKNLIQLRSENELLSLALESDIRNAIEFRPDIFHPHNPNAIGYTLDAHEKQIYGAKKLFVIINPYKYPIAIDLKEVGWKKLFTSNELYCKKRFEVVAPNGFTLEPLQGIVLAK